MEPNPKPLPNPAAGQKAARETKSDHLQAAEHPIEPAEVKPARVAPEATHTAIVLEILWRQLCVQSHTHAEGPACEAAVRVRELSRAAPGRHGRVAGRAQTGRRQAAPRQFEVPTCETSAEGEEPQSYTHAQ